MNKGKKVSEETKKKISLAHIGLPSPTKGRKLSQETKELISLARRRSIMRGTTSFPVRTNNVQVMCDNCGDHFIVERWSENDGWSDCPACLQKEREINDTTTGH
jgi:hypothetical protein